MDGLPFCVYNKTNKQAGPKDGGQKGCRVKNLGENEKSGLLTRLGLVYAAAVFVWLPLYLYNGYIQLITGKAALFYILTLGFCAAALWIGRPKRSLWLLLQGEDGWLLSLCGLFFLSTLLSKDKGTSFWGVRERSNGLLMMLCCAGGFFLVRAALRREHAELLLRFFLGAAAVSAGIGWLNYFKIDPLDTYYSLRPEKADLFLSTVGNTNFFGAYIAMAAAAALFLCAKAQDPRRSFAFGALAVFLASALLPASSDAAWLGFYAAAMLLLCLKKTTGREVSRVFTVAALVLLVGALAGIAARFFPVLSRFHVLSSVAGRPAFACAAALVLLLAALLVHKSQRKFAALFRVAAVLLILGIVLLFYLANCTGFPLGVLQDALTFGPGWGSNRGYVWGRLWYSFNQYFTPQDKMFGVGPDGVNGVLNPAYTPYIIALNSNTFDQAHNVYLQLLLSCGGPALFCWCVFLLQWMIRGFQKRSAAAMAVLVYSVQAFFSIDMPAVLPLCFVLAALTDLPPKEENAPAQPLKQGQLLFWTLLSGGAAAFLTGLLLR